MITPSQLQAKFPGVFDALSDAEIQLAIDEAALNIDEDLWGDYYDIGLYYLSAHILIATTPTALGGLAGASGPVTSQRAGAVSVSFAAGASAVSASSYGSTGYGQQYLTYRRQIQGGPRAIEPDGAWT
jgi:hypothetical protein